MGIFKIQIIVLFFSVLFFAQANAKILTASCESVERLMEKEIFKSVDLVSELVHITKPQKIESLKVNGQLVEFKDNSIMPIYEDRNIMLNIRFGEGERKQNSVQLNLSKCDDSFEQMGSGTLKEYVGGFVGTKNFELNCSCTFK